MAWLCSGMVTPQDRLTLGPRQYMTSAINQSILVTSSISVCYSISCISWRLIFNRSFASALQLLVEPKVSHLISLHATRLRTMLSDAPPNLVMLQRNFVILEYPVPCCKMTTLARIPCNGLALASSPLSSPPAVLYCRSPLKAGHTSAAQH